MTLRHVIYVSYILPARQVRPAVPHVLPLAVLDSDSVFLSIVCLRCEGVRAAILPRPRFTYNQLNVRTYVIDPVTGRNAVYFMRSGVTSGFTSRLTGLLGLPWERIGLALETVSGPRSAEVDYSALGWWDGEVRIAARGSAPLPEVIPPFETADVAIDHLTGPLIGFVGREESTKRFEIRHRALEVHGAELREMRFALPSSMGLLDERRLSDPDNVLLVPEAEFTVCLPARAVRPEGRSPTFRRLQGRE